MMLPLRVRTAQADQDRNWSQRLLLAGALGLIMALASLFALLPYPEWLLAILGILLLIPLLWWPTAGLLSGVFGLSLDQYYLNIGFALKPWIVLFGLTSLALLAKSAKRRESLSASISVPGRFWLICFLVGTGLSLIVANDAVRGLRLYIVLLLLSGLYVLVPLLVRDERTISQIIAAWFAGTAIAVGVGLGQYMTSREQTIPILTSVGIVRGVRVYGTFGDPNYFAAFLVLGLPVALIGIFQRQIVPIVRILLAGLALLMGLTLILTLSRGGLLGMVVSSVGILVFGTRAGLPTRHLLGPLYLTAALGTAAVLAPDAIVVLQHRLPDLLNVDRGSAVNLERIRLWEAALEIASDHPFLGIGLGNFPLVYPRYAEVDVMVRAAIAHNSFLELLAETGPLTLLMGLIFFGQVLRRGYYACVSRGSTSWVAVGFLSGAIGFLVQMLTVSIHYTAHFWFVLGLLIALDRISRKV